MFFGLGQVGRQSIAPKKGAAIVNASPTLDLTFVDGSNTLSPLVTFTRASTATYFDSSGVMQLAANNVPRFDCDPVTHVLNGLLIEEQRQNVIVGSSDFTVWVNTETTATAAASIAPDSSNTMSRIAEAATNALHYVWQLSAVPAGVTLTASAFFKMQQVRYLQMFLDNGSGIGGYVTFDLQAATITGPLTAIGGATIGTATIQAVGGGIYRIAMSTTISGASSRLGFILSNVPNPAFAGSSYPGNTANGVLLWGAQVEAGAFPTSYIPTTTVAVTRAFDQCFIAPANVTPWFVSPGGSWMAEFINVNPAPQNSRIVAQGQTTTGSRTPLFLGTLNGSQYDGAAAVATANVSVVNTIAKMSSTWAAGQAKICLNGGAVVSSAALTNGYGVITTNGVSFMHVNTGEAVPTDDTTGWIRRVRYWPRALSDAELQAVTT